MRSKFLFFPVFVILLNLLTRNTMAQSIEQRKTDSVFQLVKTQFNAKNADQLYELTGSRLKKDLIIEAFRNICNYQLFVLGEIKESSLISFENNKDAIYKLNFSTGKTLQLLMSLDKNDKLAVFLFQPYKKAEGEKKSLASSSNLLKTIDDRHVDTAARVYIQKANTVGLSIGVLKDGKINYYEYGETARGNGKLPAGGTLFEIGSITKTFTSTLLAYYVNEGKLKLSDPITKYLPDSVTLNKALHGITLQNLSNHTSGLPSLPPDFFAHVTDTLNPYKDYTKRLLFSYLKTCTLNSQPGEKYAYSNMAAGLLGILLEHISGKTYEQMVTEIITQPLQMNSTVQNITPLLKPRLASVYNEDGKQTEVWDFSALAPCGSLKSTVNNLLIYAKANMAYGSTKLSEAIELTHNVTFDKDIKVCLAWHIIKVDGVEYYFHNGGTYGSSSFLAFNKEKNIAIVILSNCGESVDGVGVNILKKIQ
ncbi:serine hydrolase domain-containing protein [Mucilaginibacter sp.]